MREYFLCYPSILSWWLVFDLLEINISKKHFFAVPITAALCTTILIYFYADVYRDKPVSELKTCVSDGIWKGCIATDQRARDVVLLEKSIRELTNADQTILFMDWASFGYMMTEGKALTPTTLDSILIQYNLNDPQIMFDYYEMKGEIPDVIVWIDYGLISPPSNEDNNRQFNTFLNAYYSFFEEQEIGELKLVVYQLK